MPSQVAAWLAQPFDPSMSAARWFLFIGLIILLLWGWHEVWRGFAMVEGSLE